MTDRERVLINIAVDTSGSVFDTVERLNGGWSLRFHFGRAAAQFIPEEMAKRIGMPLVPGDIIRCETNSNHRWGIAEFVERLGYSDFLLREIGGSALLKMGNESISVLRFMEPSRLYTGAKYRIYKWATGKAFRKPYNPDADEHWKRCGGVEFDGDTLVIWMRSHIFGMEIRQEDGSKLYAQPRRFTMPWSDKTRLRDIVGEMRSQGFAAPFEYLPTEPTEGQAGYVKITRDDVMGVISQATDR